MNLTTDTLCCVISQKNMQFSFSFFYIFNPVTATRSDLFIFTGSPFLNLRKGKPEKTVAGYYIHP
jgi:hypothetical protein